MKRTYKQFEELLLLPCGYSEATENLHFSQPQVELFLNTFYEPLKQKVKELELKESCSLIDGFNCSFCGASQADIRKKYSNFCSNCGRKIMEEVQDEVN